MTTLSDIKRAYSDLIHLEDDSILDIVYGAVIASQLPGDAICLYIVGPPSVGKTEIIRAFLEYPRSHHLSSLTPNTFMSGFSNHKGETSLLLRLSNGGKNIIFLKDFTSILTMRAENRAEIASQVREIIDGYYCRETGGEKNRIEWKGKLSFIAGVTKAIERESEVATIMGERFLLTRIRCNNSQMDCLTKAVETVGREESYRQRISDLTLDLVTNLPLGHIMTYPEPLLRQVKAAAIFLSNMRCHVPRTYNGQVDLSYSAEPEGPVRILKQLLQIGRGIGAIHGKLDADQPLIKLLLTVVSDSMPSIRWELISYLWRECGASGELQTTTISNYLGKPRQSVFRYLEDMEIVNLILSRQDVNTTFWRLNPIIIYLLRESGLC